MDQRIAFHPIDAPPAEDEGANRADLLLSKFARGAWLMVAAGVLIPFFALWGAWRGYDLRSVKHPQGTLLMALGLTVFFVRVGLWLLYRA